MTIILTILLIMLVCTLWPFVKRLMKISTKAIDKKLTKIEEKIDKD